METMIHIITYEINNTDGQFIKHEIFDKPETKKWLEGALKVLAQSSTVSNVRLFECTELEINGFAQSAIETNE